MSFRTTYADDGRATVFAGQQAVLTLRAEPYPERMADWTWVQRVTSGSQVLVEVTGQVVTGEDDGLPDLRFVIPGAETEALLPAGRDAVDLRHYVVRDPAFAHDVYLEAPFQVRALP